MNKQDGQEFLAQQEAKAEIADQLFELMAHDDKWGLTYVKTQHKTNEADPDEAITNTHKPNRNGHKKVAVKRQARMRQGMG